MTSSAQVSQSLRSVCLSHVYSRIFMCAETFLHNVILPLSSVDSNMHGGLFRHLCAWNVAVGKADIM